MPIPADDAARVAALHALGLLDTPPEERFERITRTAQRVFDVPIVLVSLVDTNRQWFKSCLGLTISETERNVSFCAHAVLSDEPLVIPDAQADPRFAHNPLVTGDPFIRFYAGQPLHGQGGHRVGTLCVIDRRPRDFAAEELQTLRDLGTWAENELNAVTLSQALAERNTALEGLREEMVRTREQAELLDLARDAIIVRASPEDTVRSWSRGAERLYGWRADEALGADPHKLLRTRFPVDLADVDAALQRDGYWEGELEQAARDGRTVTVASRWVMRREPTAVTTILEINTDVTDRKPAEEARARLAAIVDSAEEAIIGKALDGVITNWNAAAERLYGYTAAEAIGERITLIVPPERSHEVPMLLQRAGSGERIASFETQRRTKAGTIVDVSLSLSPIRGAAGEVTGIATIAQDITERKRVAAQLHGALDEQRRLYAQAEAARAEARAVLDAADEAMLLVGPDQRLLAVNRQAEERLGLREVEFLGRSITEVVERTFAGPEHFVGMVAESATDQVRSFSDILQQHAPQSREFAVYSTPVHTADGMYLGRLCVFRDVTREREVDRMKTEFVSLVSHELRTPLTSIKGYVELLQDEEIGASSEDRAAFLQIVKNNTDRLMDLINNLLDISWIESGTVTLQRSPVDLGQLARATADLLLPQLMAKRQPLHLDLPPDLPLVLGDADRITQILTNLLSNAHKYTPAGGDLRLSAARDHDYVVVEVSDSGIGMTPDELGKLFTRFYRASNRTTQEVGGTGLGLAITRSLVELHGGQISVQSTHGRGSTFRFSLPGVAAGGDRASKGPGDSR